MIEGSVISPIILKACLQYPYFYIRRYTDETDNLGS